MDGMGPEEITLDLDGDVVHVPREAVRELAAAAAVRAGVSTRHRDLSLGLGRALESGTGSLGSNEVRALRAVLEEAKDALGDAGAELLRAASIATA